MKDLVITGLLISEIQFNMTRKIVSGGIALWRLYYRAIEVLQGM